MQKLFYLLFDDPAKDGDALREALIEKVAPTIRDCGGQDLYVFASDAEVAAGQPMGEVGKRIRAMVSFWLEDAADRGPAEAALDASAQSIAGYLVVESRPMIHSPPKGERTPGMKQISAVTKRADISPEEFIRIWHTDHRQVAIETQSTFGYVRNEIFRALTPDAPDQWDAFVEESFPIEALTDPLVFYDARTQEEYERNFGIMMESCGRFLDHGPIAVAYTSEYWLG